LRRGGLGADGSYPAVARRARPVRYRGGAGTGVGVPGAADRELVAVGTWGFGGWAAFALTALGPDHPGDAAGPVGVGVPESVGDGVRGPGGAAERVGFCFVVGYRFALPLGVAVGLGVAVAFAVCFPVCIAVAFAVCIAVAFAVCIAVAFAVCIAVAFAVCIAVAFAVCIAVAFAVCIAVGVFFYGSVDVFFAVWVGEFGLRSAALAVTR
jgi:hypothetical protein